jgi:hypothetical protein
MTEQKFEIEALDEGFIVWRTAAGAGWRRCAVESAEDVAVAVLRWLGVRPEDLITEEKE